MIARISFLFVSLLVSIQIGIGLATAQTTNLAPQEVTFSAADGVKIYADIYIAPKGKSAPLIMLFHQGDGDARGEYRPLVSRLLAQGFSAITIDQRSGGNRFGSINRTVARLGDKTFSYCAAYEDLKATLLYVKKEGFTGKRLAWGSSYSAALVIRLGVEHPHDLAGILAFSPASGEVMNPCQPEPYIPKLKIPALLLRPAAEMKVGFAREQFALAQKYGQQTFVADVGAHGSSMLNPARAKGNVEESWKKVLNFIKQAPARNRASM